MQEFVHLFSELIHVFPNEVGSPSHMKKWMNNPIEWISIQMHDLLLANVNPLPLDWWWVIREITVCQK
jgi:hypothetical protein